MKSSNQLAEGQIELAFFPLDLDYEILDGHTVIRIFGSTPDKKRVAVIDKNFAPYFRAIISPDTNLDEFTTKLKNLEVRDKEQIIKIQGVQIKDKKFLREDVKAAKITVAEPSDISKIRAVVKNFPEVISTQEFDIKFYRRYLIDKGITPCTLCRAIGKIVRRSDLDVDIALEADNVSTSSSDLISNPKIIGFDIETQCKGAFPTPEEDPIIMLSFFGDGIKKVVTWKKFSGAPDYTVFVDGELELLEEFKKTIKQVKPEILVGYGSDSFDLPFLKGRAQKYGLKLDLGLDGSEPEISNSAQIKGILHLDIVKFIRNILDLGVDRFKLDLVAKELLGKGKLFSVKPHKINELWTIGLAQDLTNLVNYNLIDSQLAYELCSKLLPTQLQIIKIIGLPLFDTNRMSYGQLVEWFLIKNSRRFNQIIPRRPSFHQIMERRKHTFTGAFVIEPKPGLYKDICVFDFRSLYPSIIASHNIDLATTGCECCKYKGGFVVENEGIHFCSKEKGFIPSLIQDVIERRNRIISILNKTEPSDAAYVELKARRYALKTIANSTYGYMGYAGSRWHSLECAKAVTELGRKYIKEVIKEAQKFGFDVLYADTDSVFFLKGERTKEDVMKFLKIINSVLPKPMELEYQDFYPAGIFLEKKGDARGAKKRYALLDKKGNISLKGVEAVRGDWSNIAREAQRTVIELILTRDMVDIALKYIQGLIKAVKERKIALEEFVIEERLTKDLEKYVSRGPHVAAAELAKQKGQIVRKGFTVNYVVGKGTGKISDRVILAEDAKLEDYDPDYYIDHQIIRAVYKIFEIFGYAEEKLKGGQTTLSGF